MKQREYTITEFVEKFRNGEFNSKNKAVQCDAGWYDWFCNDTALAGKTKVLGAKVASIMDSKRFDKDSCYVFFKNNCPLVGPLYDQFSICDIQTGDVLFCIQHLNRGSHGCDKAHWDVYSNDNFHDPAVSGSWSDCKKWFMDK